MALNGLKWAKFQAALQVPAPKLGEVCPGIRSARAQHCHPPRTHAGPLPLLPPVSWSRFVFKPTGFANSDMSVPHPTSPLPLPLCYISPWATAHLMCPPSRAPHHREGRSGLRVADAVCCLRVRVQCMPCGVWMPLGWKRGCLALKSPI